MHVGRLYFSNSPENFLLYISEVVRSITVPFIDFSPEKAFLIFPCHSDKHFQNNRVLTYAHGQAIYSYIVRNIAFL